MKLIQDLQTVEVPFHNGVITIGNFDGVHIGHQALFHTVIETADAMDGTSMAMTFDPHPIRVLKKGGHPPLITIYEQKVELIERTGIDVLFFIPFTLEFASISAISFIKDLLMKKLGVKAIVVGNDYTFGKKREGNVAMLRSMAPSLGLEVIVVDWIQSPDTQNGRTSSTKIRETVMAGDMREAHRLLGRHYQIRGQVQTGRNRGGKLLGFPTANINLQDELCPRTGVYAVTVEWRGKPYLGVANIGYSPTFDDHLFTVEVHLLDFKETLYGETIRVNFIERIRDEKKFSGLSELSAQIRNDVRAARMILSL